jgi:maleylpyruvate isomerase
MATDLQTDQATAIALCQLAHARLLGTSALLTDDEVRRPSRLPDWSIGHVLTHLTRNADGHVRRLEGALRGEELARYAGGTEQRNAEIASGSTRTAAEMATDLERGCAQLEETWERCVAAGWPHAELGTRDDWPTTSSPAQRLREVEMHHLDLGLGYQPADWPEDYVTWELAELLATLPGRVRRTGEAAELVAWLSGRRATAPELDLEDW